MDNDYYDYLNALQQFQIWLGSPDSVFTVKMAPFEDLIHPIDISDSIFLAEHPIIKVTAGGIEVAEAEIEVNRKEIWPKLQLEYRQQTEDGISAFNTFQIRIEV